MLPKVGYGKTRKNHFYPLSKRELSSRITDELLEFVKEFQNQNFRVRIKFDDDQTVIQYH